MNQPDGQTFYNNYGAAVADYITILIMADMSPRGWKTELKTLENNKFVVNVWRP